MAQQKVELRKLRDLSENLNDTFAFIRQNFKPLVTSFLGIAGIIMLSNAIANGMYQYESGNLYRDILQSRGRGLSPLSIISPTYFAVILLAWLNFIAMNVVVICYIKLYDLLHHSPTIQEVWDEFKKYVLKVFLYSIPVTLVTMFGFVFCLLPGIYFAVVFAPFATVLIVEDKSFGDAWNRCFEILKDNFWNSLGIYVVVYIVYAVCAGIVSMAITAFAGLITYLTTKDRSATMGIATSVLNIFSFVFYIIFYVSVCLHYFNLVERHD